MPLWASQILYKGNIMSFKPKSNQPENTSTTERKPFVAIVPEDGLQAVQVGALVYLGEHKKLPKFAKDNAGNREKEEDGVTDKVLFPKEGKDTEQKVGVYVDLLSQTYDYGEDIGEKNIRLPLHQVVRGMSEGISLTTVAPRNPKDNSYIKGIPWSYAGQSNWNKIAAVTFMEDGKTKVSEKMCKADYKNPYHNDISLLLGKPFMYNVEVKVQEDGENKYVNTKLKSPVPLMKGMPAPAPTIKAVSINFNDSDLLEEKEELGGARKIDLLRQADLRKIVIALDYEGTKMQEAIREVYDEDTLIEKAKEISAKIIETDRDLKEIRSLYPEKFGITSSSTAQPAPQDKSPTPNFDDMDDDQAPF